jgi:hypothetical protein
MAVQGDRRNGKEGIRLCRKDFMCDLKWQWDCYISVAGIRLVKTENPSACVTVNCKVCRIAIALQLPVVPSCVNKVSINAISQSRTHLISHAHLVHVTIFWSAICSETPPTSHSRRLKDDWRKIMTLWNCNILFCLSCIPDYMSAEISDFFLLFISIVIILDFNRSISICSVNSARLFRCKNSTYTGMTEENHERFESW